MRFFAKLGIAAAIAAALCGPANAAEFRVTTWNMEWLTDGSERANGKIPKDAIRAPGDADAVRSYAEALGAEVVAFQEVDGFQAAATVFDPAKYDILLADDDGSQLVGVAIRKGVRYQRNPDVKQLDAVGGGGWGAKAGVDVTVWIGQTPVRMLAVHLKSGCWSTKNSLDPRKREACGLMERQIGVIKEWATARATEGTPYMIAGDFNRNFGTLDPVWQYLAAGTNLIDPAAGMKGRCWGGKYSNLIDHVLLDPKAASLASTITETVYSETGRAAERALPDHCPLSVDFKG